jgi:multiple sugar transport system substrate-binding protein
MLEAAQKLTKDDGSQYGFCSESSNDQDTYYNFVYANDGYNRQR